MPVFVGADNIISPLGFTSSENFTSILQGKVAVKKQTFSFSDELWCCSKIDRHQLDTAFSTFASPDKYTFLERMCILSIQDIIQQTGVDIQSPETLLIISTTKGNIDVLEGAYENMDVSRAYLSSFANTLGKFFSCATDPLVVSNACISGVLSIIAAKRFIENKMFKHVLVCGADIITEFTLSGFKSFNALSEEPSKPFDENRVGINLGEAASSILLSEDPIGTIQVKGGCSANDANHISGPSRTGEGLFKAIAGTLKGAEKKNIDLISAHGTATAYNDEMESIAFTRAGLENCPVNSLKGYYGHTLGAAGVIETVVSIQSMLNNTLIKSMGFDAIGTSKKINVVEKTQSSEVKTFLKTASGFGGCNAAALFEKI